MSHCTPSEPCPMCGAALSMIFRHIGGKGACPHALCESCGYQRRLVPVTTPAR